MLKDEDLTDELYDTLIHQDIDPDEFLMHYGVPGMQWGRRKEDRAERKAGGGRLVTLKTKNGTPIASVVRRTSPAEQLVKNIKLSNEKRKATNARITAAFDKYYDDDNDTRSDRTKNIRKAGNIAIVGALGTAGVSILAKNPYTKIGAGAVSLILSTGTAVLNGAEMESLKKDVLKNYGD